jgi:vitamin B12 transporter
MNNNNHSAARAAFCIAILSTLSFNSHASDKQGPASEDHAGTVIVTATRSDNDIDQVLATSMVIERSEIEESQARDVADLLRSKAGIDIASNGGPGQTTSVFLRGAESDHTLFMVDGIKINPATLGVASVQNIPVNMIERIEIIMGPRSTLYGSDAIGGVIQIFTRDGATSEAGWRFGSYDTHELSASVHRRSGDMRFGLDISGTRSDGFPARAEGNEDSPYKNDSLNFKLGNSYGNTDLDFQYMGNRGRTDYYNFLLSPVAQDFKNSLASLNAKITASDSWVSKLKFGYFEDDIQQRESTDFLNTTRYEVDWQNDVAVGSSHLLTAGIQAYRENSDSLSFGSGFEDESDTVGIYLQDQFESGSNQLTAGLRYTDHSAFDGKTTGELSYGYQASKSTKLLASFATGFRAPGSTDRFGFGGNPDLKPETSQSLELSARFNPATQHRTRLSLYQNEIDDLISFVDPDGFAGPVAGRNENIDRTRTRGMELTYSYRQHPFVVDASMTYQDPKDLSTDKQLPRRAKEKLALTGRYIKNAYTFSAELTHTGERPDSAYSDIVLDAFTLLNLSATTVLADRLQIGLRLDNITDEDYQLADGFNTAGRSIFMNLRYINRR